MAITSAIVPFKGNTSSAVIKPQQQMTSAIVKVEKLKDESTEDPAREMRKNALMLLRKRQQRDRLEQKYFKLLDQTKARQKAREEEKKQESTSFLTKAGSGVKKQAEKLGGNLFSAIGDILGFLALDWISKPENQATLTGIVEGVKHIFAFVDWWVTGSVDNLLTGFSQLVGKDSTLLERVIGFFKVAAGVLGLRYFLKPWKLFTDVQKLIKTQGLRKLNIFFKKWQKKGIKDALKFAFPKISSIVSKVFNGIKGAFSKASGGILGKIGNAMLRVLKKPGFEVVKKAVGALVKPALKVVKKIPFIGPLISFGVSMAFGVPIDKAIFRAIGSGLGSWLGGGLGSLIFPGVGTFIGGVIGSFIGEWLGDRVYDMMQNKSAKPPNAEEARRMEAIKLKAELSKNKNLSESDIVKEVAKKMKISEDEAKKLLSKTPLQADPKEPKGTPTIAPVAGGAKGILAFIAKGEGGYNSMNQGTKGNRIVGSTGDSSSKIGKKLTDLTIEDIIKRQDYLMNKSNPQEGNYGLFAVGRYQFIPSTFKSIVRDTGIDPKTKFTPDVQDKLGMALLRRDAPAAADYIDGKSTDRVRALTSLAKVWASIPLPNGNSAYGSGNRAGHTPQEVYAALDAARSKGGGLPSSSIRKQIPQRSSSMSSRSMDMVQSKRSRNRKSNIIVINNGGQTIASYTNFNAVQAPRGLNNRKVSHKRGL